MNATPMTPSTAIASQGTASTRKGDPAAADTPFSQILSDEIALQTAAGACEPHCGKTLADRLAELLDNPADPDTVTDPSLAFQASTDTTAPPPTAETLAALGLSLAPPTGQVTTTQHDAQLDEAMTSDAPVSRAATVSTDLPTSTTLPASTSLSAGTTPPAGMFPRTAAEPAAAAASGVDAPTSANTPARDSEAFSGLFAARLAAEGARAAEPSPELISPVALRPAVVPGAADTGPAPTLAAAPRLAPEVGNAAWGQALGEKIVWMASGKQQSASLTLNPPNLGPLHIVLNVSSDQATANFFAAQPEVRQAIEAALPRLREMMGEAGIQLGQANVSADTPSQNQASGQESSRAASHPGALADADEPTVVMPVPRTGRGLVDTFA